MKRSLGLAIKKEWVSLCGFILGIVSVIFSIVIFSMDSGILEDFGTYGGDAYTGIQNATAATAYNLVVLTESVQIIGGAILFVFGAVIMLCFAGKIYKTYQSDECLINLGHIPYQYQQTPEVNYQYTANFEFCSSCGTKYDKNAGACPNCNRR